MLKPLQYFVQQKSTPFKCSDRSSSLSPCLRLKPLDCGYDFDNHYREIASGAEVMWTFLPEKALTIAALTNLASQRLYIL